MINWEIVSVLEELQLTWDNLLSLVERVDGQRGGSDPSRDELLMIQETELPMKFHAMGLVYSIGYFSFMIYYILADVERIVWLFQMCKTAAGMILNAYKPRRAVMFENQQRLLGARTGNQI